MRILIVDDQPQVRQGLATVLRLASKKAGLTLEVVGEAQNGADAVQQAGILAPDVILMDLAMPILDGYEATRRIKLERPAARVIVLSVHADPQTQERTRVAGADGFVAKGCGYEVLLEAILANQPFPPATNENVRT